MGDFLMEGDERLNEAKQERWNDEILPILHKMTDRTDDLEGLERAGTISDDEKAELARYRDVIATVRGGKDEIINFFDSPKGQEIKNLLKDPSVSISDPTNPEVDSSTAPVKGVVDTGTLLGPMDKLKTYLQKNQAEQD